MDKKNYRMEYDLLANRRGEQLDLAQGALVASGASTYKDVQRYLNRIDHICETIEESACDVESDEGMGRHIFECLWKSNPHRYKSQGHFRLTDVIEAQLGRKKTVGNCLGLTLLYNVVAKNFGLNVSAVHLDNAFGQGPHVFSVLHTGERTIDVENIFSNGFDYPGHLGAPQRKEWTERELIADIYNSVGNELLESNKKKLAIRNYEKAIALNPEYTRALLNKGIALTEMGRDDEAGEWFRTIAP